MEGSDERDDGRSESIERERAWSATGATPSFSAAGTTLSRSHVRPPAAWRWAPLPLPKPPLPPLPAANASTGCETAMLQEAWTILGSRVQHPAVANTCG